MKNREYRVLLAMALMVSLAVGSVKESTMYVHASDHGTAVVSENQSEAKMKKDETVYAKIGTDGTVQSVTVSDQLKNITDQTKIVDVSGLKDIENVKGDETFEQKDGKMTWEGAQKEICYQGTTDKALPVGVKITYRLDGKEVSAKELDGKSGHLEIQYEYQNTTADGEGYTPFLMATGLVLDTDKFSNVVIDNGKIVSDGERDIVIGMGIPRLKEALGADGLDIPDSFVVEADVTEYEAVEGITIATNSIFNELSTDEFESIDELKAGVTELQSASEQLVSGSGELKEGLDLLLASSGTLVDGIDRLAAGGNALSAGSGELFSGVEALDAGTGTVLLNVRDVLLPGVERLDAGANQMQESLVSEDVQKLTNGIKSLDAAFNTGDGKGTPSLTEAAADMKNGIDTVASGMKALDAGLDICGENAETTAEKSKLLAEAIAKIPDSSVSGGQTTIASAKVSDVAGSGVATGVATGTATGSAVGVATVDLSNEIDELRNLSGQMEDGTEAKNVVLQVIGELETRQNSEVVIEQAQIANATMEDAYIEQANVSGVSGTGTATADVGAVVKEDLAQIKQDAANVAKSAAAVSVCLNEGDASNGIPGIREVAQSLNTGLNVGDGNGSPSLRDGMTALNSGIVQTASGAKMLNEGINGKNGLTEQLCAGTTMLKEGTEQLAEGVGGGNGLVSGIGELKNGTSKLAKGAEEVDGGAVSLAAGLGTLQSGTGTLTDGVRQLADGAGTLHDGMMKFDEDGIQKLVNVFEGDIGGLLDNVNGILESSRNYKNFSGIADDMDGEVKFVFVSGE